MRFRRLITAARLPRPACGERGATGVSPERGEGQGGRSPAPQKKTPLTLSPQAGRGNRVKAIAAYGFLAITLAACTPPAEPPSPGGPLAMRRLTEDQYRNTIGAVFGPDIKITGRFEPGVRTDGLLAVGNAMLNISASGFEQYDVMGRTVAAQALDEKHRAATVPCQPADEKLADDACAAQVLSRIGRLVHRRTLSDAEVKDWTAAAAGAARTTGSFYGGLELALAAMLVSPDFLFVTDRAEADPAHQGQRRLTATAQATRLSLLLWNAGPDDALLAAAEKGELASSEGLAHQVDRMLRSPRLETGVRNFFTDFLGFDKFDTFEKDPVIYPAAGPAVATDAREQTLRTVVDHLLTRGLDYRDLFTTRRTFVTRELGAIYVLPVTSRDAWEPVEFAADDPRAGILTHVSFVGLYAHPGRSSATLRGKAVRELLLCEPVPAPPNNVNFSIVQDTKNPNFKTARDRLTAHRADPTCAGCHKVIDPIGLALERFDGIGQMRAEENGAAIDVSGELDGVAYDGAAGLGKTLRDNPAVPSCLAESLYRYGVGRNVTADEKPWLGFLKARFAADGYRLAPLLRRIALSPAFYALTPETTSPLPLKEARS